MSKTIVVLGATGTQGGSVARTFLRLPGWKVRGVTRNRQSASARELETLGVEVVEANLDDVKSLERAFTGAAAIFGVTDFWQFVQDPKTHALAEEKKITWNEAACLLEIQQGKNIIDAAVRCVSQGGDNPALERLVLSTLCNVRKASGGKYTWVYHFDGKAQFVEYLKDMAGKDADYRKLFDKTSYLQMGNYLDNWKKNPIFTPQRQPDGTVVFGYITPEPSATSSSSSTKPIHPSPFVHPPTDTGPFVEALILRAPSGTTLLGTCSMMPFADYVKLWGELLNVKTALAPVTVEEVEAKFPGGFGLEVAQTVCFVSEFGWDGGEGAVLPEQIGVKMDELTDVAEYIKQTDWSSVLG